jgi:electron transport complex protein RnfG
VKNAVILSVSLGLVCAIASGILAFAYDLTFEAQEKAKMADLLDGMNLLFPDAEFAADADPQTVEDPETGVVFKFYPALVDGVQAGVVATGATMQGFGGRLDVMVGIDLPGGDIRKVLVTDHEETPGLGTQATDRQRKKSLWTMFKEKSADESQETSRFAPNTYLDQYDGKTAPENGVYTVVKSADAVKDRNDVLAITGATITSRAVADAVSRTMDAYNKVKP